MSESPPRPDDTEAQERIRGLLTAWRGGDMDARDRLFSALYGELLQIAAALVRTDRNTSLSSGDLLDEAVIRLIGLNRIEWQDKAHFLALSARVMRRVLIDQARKRNAGKHHHHKVTLQTRLPGHGVLDLELDRLDKALIRLSVIDPKRAEIAELRFFGNLTVEEISEVTGMSDATVKRTWRATRAWLMQALDGPGLDPIDAGT